MPSNPGTPRLLRGINDRAALTLLLEHGPAGKVRLKRMDPPELAASVIR